MEPQEFKLLTQECERAWLALGKVNYGVSSEEEKKSKMFRRSIYVSSDIQQGEEFSLKNIRCVRPSYGLETKYFESVLGQKSSSMLKKGTPLKRQHIVSED